MAKKQDLSKKVVQNKSEPTGENQIEGAERARMETLRDAANEVQDVFAEKGLNLKEAFTVMDAIKGQYMEDVYQTEVK